MALRILIKTSLLLTVVVIMLGAYTRLSDAGLGCPDWPGCYGHLTVPNEHHELAAASERFPHLTVEADKAWAEMIHRYFAGTLGLVVLAIAVFCIRNRHLPTGHGIALALVIVFQALLGMWTVTMKLLPLVVMGHLLGGFTLLCLLSLLYWRVRLNPNAIAALNQPDGPLITPGVKRFATLALAVVIIQIALGGWTSSNYAALMCTSLPLCEGNWLQSLDFANAFQLIHFGHDSYEFGVLDYEARMTIHVTHRIGAIVTAVVVLISALLCVTQQDSTLRSAGRRMMLALVIQLGLGITNVVFSLPLMVAVAHNIGAAFLLVSTLYTNYLLWSGVEIPQVNKERVHE
ncbi:COX15/CtaA family protein [Vibrio sp.]|uniref:COX15/CtaA family protein n=1 Tax=Vibrio sp. TaxID=678 RepID=UPI003D0DA80E